MGARVAWKMELRMHRRPCWVEISTSAFEHNYRVLVEACERDAGPPFKASLGPDDNTPEYALQMVFENMLREQNAKARALKVELLAIVKADAYGHGLPLCAPAAVRSGARWLGVTSVEEGAAARELCAGFPETQILVIAGQFQGQGAEAIARGLTCVVWEPWQIEELEAAACAAECPEGSIPVHLELDTGMSRQGVEEDRLDEVLTSLEAAARLRLDGLMTHLYAADETDGFSTHEQMGLLERMIAKIAEAGLISKEVPIWLHLGNSAAVLGGDILRDLRSLCGRWGFRPMARPGLALYGLAPEFYPNEPPHAKELRHHLRRVLEWKTQVVSVRDLAAGQVVGYNATFVATEPMRLALLAVGYGDGLSRALSTRPGRQGGFVLLGGQRAPIVGRISMDQTVVDVTEIPGLAPGDEAVLLGRQGDESITAEEHAAWAGTIPWEIFTSITARVERQGIGTRD